MKNIDDCFERGMLRKVEPSRIKSEQSLLQAGDWLSEAEKNLEAEALRSAISSAYMTRRWTWDLFLPNCYHLIGALQIRAKP